MNILLADDHTLVRQGLMPFLRALDPDVAIVEAADFAEALDKAKAQVVLDIILLDLRMPGMQGTRGLETMVAAFPNVPVVILSGSVDAGDVMSCAEKGAAGYIPKTLNSTAMINALRLVLSGERYFPSFVFSGPKPMPESEFEPSNPLAALEDRERIILGMVVDGRTNKEIARSLDLQEVTIKVQTRNIYRKLGAVNRSQAVRIAMENGWRNEYA